MWLMGKDAERVPGDDYDPPQFPTSQRQAGPSFEIVDFGTGEILASFTAQALAEAAWAELTDAVRERSYLRQAGVAD